MMQATSTIPTIDPPVSTPSPNIPTLQKKYREALARASAAGLVAFKVDARTYEVPSASTAGQLHMVRVTGTHWYELSCDCAGSNHPACQHRATALFAILHHVHAKRPAAVVAQAEAIAASAPALSYCTDCLAESSTGVTLCIECSAERQRRWGVKEANDAACAFHGIAPQPIGSIIPLPTTGSPFKDWA